LVKDGAWRQRVVVIKCPEIGQQLFGNRAQFDVAFLRAPFEEIERSVGVNTIDHHQDALDLFDDGAVSAISATALVMKVSRSSGGKVTST
jgi:hypothetical protein